jgi:hypothetical protein
MFVPLKPSLPNVVLRSNFLGPFISCKDTKRCEYGSKGCIHNTSFFVTYKWGQLS